MKTYPYTTDEGIIDLVRKGEHDAVVAELLERLQERTESHLAASARDVQTIQQQAVELSGWQAEAARLSAEREHNANMAGMWQALAERLATCAKRCFDALEACGWIDQAQTLCDTVSAYESAKSGNLPDPLAEAVKRMEAVTNEELNEAHWSGQGAVNCFEANNRVRARLIQAAKGEQP